MILVVFLVERAEWDIDDATGRPQYVPWKAAFLVEAVSIGAPQSSTSRSVRMHEAECSPMRSFAELGVKAQIRG
jgi:hypothetical protein